ncbi:MAG: S-methyl-5'-thioadenosine phosphorylase [Acidobacteria bacterium]|nr:S-methyl-5'-thioadenosine phosphorylase [Acidobacteriota bacterium]
MKRADIGIIGGSGLYHMAGLKIEEELVLETPFGPPSDAFLMGEVAGKKVAFLARHNRKHNILPSELNFRANIWAMKKLGVSYLISASAVGSLKAEYAPTHFVFPDQFIDRTRHRIDTFFGAGVVAHVGFSDPICPILQKILFQSAQKAGIVSHFGGTYLNMEGPQFSTKAESHLYRSWGADVIGMTNLQEAKLAREAEIAYATIAMVTDYDCWHEEEEPVSVEMVIATLKKNANAASDTIAEAVAQIDLNLTNPIHDAMKFAVMTPLDAIPAQRREELAVLLGKYWGHA